MSLNGAVAEARSDVDEIRHELLTLNRQAGVTQADMAALLYQVWTRRLFDRWTYPSFAAYVLYELELAPRYAYEAVETYKAYQSAWDRARMIGWARLREAAPLVTQGKWVPSELVEALADPSATVRTIRDWKANVLKVGSPRIEPAGEARIAKVVPSPKEGEPDIVIHPDMELVDGWTTNGTSWVKVTMTLPQSVLLLLVETCSLARERLQIDRAPEDDRWTLPREIEALCQEVAIEWHAQVEEDGRR